MSEDWRSTLIDRMFSIPFYIFCIILLAAVFGVLNPKILHEIRGDLTGLFK